MTESGASQQHVIPIRDLPKELTRSAHEVIRRFAVTMILSNGDADSNVKPCSGTFVVVNGRAGILTARHVWEEFRKFSRLILMVGERQPLYLETKYLTSVPDLAHSTLEQFNAKVPDIALIPLANSMRGAIESRAKSFYSIDRRVWSSEFDVFGNDGMWAVVGAPKALLRLERHAVGSMIYDTGIHRRFEHCEWDYVLVNMNVEDNPEIPSDFQGMSGGGLWRVRYATNANKSEYWIPNESTDVVLCGVAFYQTDEPRRQLIAHGPRSIYEKLREHLI